ncbi:MAG: hypothetical protein HBSAPP03_04840 [Phycisphaerae bacterium]|nr:MAG: hypothetical protein HBSAPP03_04840 [Phycisphaerae bacterium]
MAPRTRWHHLAFWVATGSLVLLFGWGVIGKINAPAGIEGAVRFLLDRDRDSGWHSRTVAAGLVFWEAFLALMLLFDASRAWVLWAVRVTLVGLTVALIVLVSDPDAPACGCFGAVRDAKDNAPLGLARNGVAMALTLVPWAVHRRTSAPDPAQHSRADGAKRAFTLIETLVVIAIVAILTAIALPLLVSSRFQARVTKRIALSQQVVTAMLQYAHEHRDGHLYFMTAGEPTRGAVFMETELTNSYFASCRNFWPNFLDRSYLDVPRQILEADTEGVIRNNLSEGVPADLVRSEISASDTLFAHPKFFEGPPVSDAGSCVGTRLDEVRFPSLKAYIVDRSLRRAGQSSGQSVVVRGFGDSSVDTVSQSEYLELGDTLVQRPFGSAPFNVLGTDGGLRGRDR